MQKVSQTIINTSLSKFWRLRYNFKRTSYLPRFYFLKSFFLGFHYFFQSHHYYLKEIWLWLKNERMIWFSRKNCLSLLYHYYYCSHDQLNKNLLKYSFFIYFVFNLQSSIHLNVQKISQRMFCNKQKIFLKVFPNFTIFLQFGHCTIFINLRKLEFTNWHYKHQFTFNFLSIR